MNGSRSVFCTRSFCTVWDTCSAGISPFSGSGGPFGLQVRKYSAISDCGSLEQRVSSPSVPSSPESSIVTTARFSSLMSRLLTVPASTPAIRTLEPGTRPKALYISTR